MFLILAIQTAHDDKIMTSAFVREMLKGKATYK